MLIFARESIGYSLLVALAGAMMCAGAEGRPLAASIDYRNIRFSKLVSIYKEAYAGAGFAFRQQSVLREDPAGNRKTSELIFEYPNPDHPEGGRGIVSFHIVSPIHGQNCMPCSVHPQVFGGEALLQYDSEDYGRFIERLNSADLQANDQIGIRLGKSVRSAPMRQCGPEIYC